MLQKIVMISEMLQYIVMLQYLQLSPTVDSKNCSL